jgi:hypothetical protein
LSLFAALFAVKSVKPVAAAARVSLRAKARDVAALYRLASRYDSVMPNLASELRHIASRG